MKLAITLFGLLVATNSFAATRSTELFAPKPSYHSGVSIGAMGGLVTAGGNYGGNFLLQMTVPVSKASPVRLGLDTGVMFSKGVSLPILVTMVFDIVTTVRNISPYVGGSVGPVIGLSSNAGDAVFGDGIKLGILVRPGINFGLTDNLNLNVELQTGGLTGIFYISPSLGLQLKV